MCEWVDWCVSAVTTTPATQSLPATGVTAAAVTTTPAAAQSPTDTSAAAITTTPATQSMASDSVTAVAIAVTTTAVDSVTAAAVTTTPPTQSPADDIITSAAAAAVTTTPPTQSPADDIITSAAAAVTTTPPTQSPAETTMQDNDEIKSNSALGRRLRRAQERFLDNLSKCVGITQTLVDKHPFEAARRLEQGLNFVVTRRDMAELNRARQTGTGPCIKSPLHIKCEEFVLKNILYFYKLLKNPGARSSDQARITFQVCLCS